MKCQNYGCRKKVARVLISQNSHRTVFYCADCMTEETEMLKVEARKQIRSTRKFVAYCESLNTRIGLIDKGVFA